MRHRANQRTTHLMTVSSKVQTGTDAQNEPLYDRQEVLADEPVRFRPEGTSYVREDGGTRVRRSPEIRGRPSLVEQVSEGDIVSLTPKTGADDTDGARFEVMSVDGIYGRHSRPARTVIEVEAK